MWVSTLRWTLILLLCRLRQLVVLSFPALDNRLVCHIILDVVLIELLHFQSRPLLLLALLRGALDRRLVSFLTKSGVTLAWTTLSD